MQIKEIIATWLADSTVIEMAMSRCDAESKITSLAEPVTEHLIKILKWNDPANSDKHARDINNWIRSIQRIKFKGGNHPSQQDFFKWMFTDMASDPRTVDLWIDGLHRYHSLPSRFTNLEVFDYIKSILFRVSEDLARKEFIDVRPYLPM